MAADEYGAGFATQEKLAILSRSGIEQKNGSITNSNYEICSFTADKSHMRITKQTTFKEEVDKKI